jgi:polysaccharide lyase-like protein
LSEETASDSTHGGIDYDIDIEHGTILSSGDINYGQIRFYRDKSPNGFAPELRKDDGIYLRLAVQRDHYRKATDGDPKSCDRCELRDTKLRLGTPVWYSFDMRAEDGFPIVDARFVCAQIKAPYYGGAGGSPLFALRIDRGRYIATVEHLYEPTDVSYFDGIEQSRYVTRYGADWCFGAARALDHHIFGNSPGDAEELQVRALFATGTRELPPHLQDEFQSCTTGVTIEHHNSLPDEVDEWWRFRLCIAPTTVKDADGVVRLYVADPNRGKEVPIATAYGEFGHAGYDPPPANGQKVDEKNQYFKLGPYRDKFKIWGDRVAAIRVRNIKRGYWAEGAELRANAMAKARMTESL